MVMIKKVLSILSSSDDYSTLGKSGHRAPH